MSRAIEESSESFSQSIERKLDAARVIDLGFWGLTLFFALGVAAILIWIVIQISASAAPAIQQFGLGFLVTRTWNPVTSVYGILPAIYGTLITSTIALLIAVPVGVGIAIFLTEDFVPSYIRTPIAFAIELIVAIPSVVLGLWGIFVLVPFMNPFFRFLNRTLGWIPIFGGTPRGTNLLIVGIVLSVMIAPIIISISRGTLLSLSPTLRQGAMAMGATRWETILRVLIPAGLSGIISSIMLALGRAMGETMVAAMLTGNANRISASLLEPGVTITSLIASQFGEAGRLQVASLLYGGLILMVMALLVNIFAQLIIRKFQNVE